METKTNLKPSAKVITSTLVALLSLLALAIGEDMSILEPLLERTPEFVDAVIVSVAVGLAGYFKKESASTAPPIH